MNASEKCRLKWCKEKVGDSKVQSPLGERFCSAKCLAEFNAALSELYKSIGEKNELKRRLNRSRQRPR